MTATNVTPKVLSQQERNLLREHLDSSSSHLEQLAHALAQIHGKRADQVVSITVKFEEHTSPTGKKKIAQQGCAIYVTV